MMASARIVVDQRTAALAEAGELIEALNGGVVREEDLTELGEIVAGSVPGRETDDQITVFKSVGLAVQDLCAAARALERADAENIGARIEI